MSFSEGTAVKVKLGKQQSRGTVVAVDSVHGSVLVQYDNQPAASPEWLPQERCKALESLRD